MTDAPRPLAEFPNGLTTKQQAALDEIVAGPRGECVGPFVALLRTPDLMAVLQQVGGHLRFSSTMHHRLVELVILTVARRWNQQFEWSYHCQLALNAGIDRGDIEALAWSRRPPTLDDEERAVWSVVDELQRTGVVSDELYAMAIEHLGESGVVEAIVTAGYYTTLAMIMNTARTPADRTPPVSLPTLPT